jgi:apolipoprotein D and lipocalin family protein
MHKSIAGLASLVACIAGCAHNPAVSPHAQASQSACVAGPPIDLERYMGRWYVIADTPFLSEHDYVGSYDEWSLREDGTIDDKYLGRRHGFDQPASGSDFVAKVMSGTGNTKWRVGLIWPFEVVVVIAYVDPEYRYTIRCMADANMVWVLSRTPAMDEAVYADMLDRLSGMGFHIDRLRRVPQSAGQIGLPGFQ